MADARLKHFGWGREGEAMTPEEESFVLERYRRRLRRRPLRGEGAARAPGHPAAGAAHCAAAEPGADLLERALRPCRPHLRQVLSRHRARPSR